MSVLGSVICTAWPDTASSSFSVTVPDAAATAGVPSAAKMSSPSCRCGNGQGRNACQSLDHDAGPATGNGPATRRNTRCGGRPHLDEILATSASTLTVLSAPDIPGGSGRTKGGGGGCTYVVGTAWGCAPHPPPDVTGEDPAAGTGTAPRGLVRTAPPRVVFEGLTAP